MKKFLCIILCTILLLGTMSFEALGESETLTHTVDGVNSSRGENQLIVFDSTYGERTNTNQWGVEAVVDAEGKVLRVTTAGNERIPNGGFVISAHGTARAWVSENIKTGMYAAYHEYSNSVVVSESDEITKEITFSVTHGFNIINGSRQTDYMVIYTGAGRRTATNEWGTEVIVENGRIVSIGSNNNIIPQNGYVVSGHGEASEWLINNAKVGMAVTYNTSLKELTLSMDMTAYSINMGFEIESAEELLDTTRKNYVITNYDLIEEKILQAKQLKDKFTDENTTDLERFTIFKDFNSTITQIIYLSSESRPVETRGCWIRPIETTRKQVSIRVQDLYDAGINTICIETNYNGMLICPAPEGEEVVWEHNPVFKGFDVLDAYIKECHMRGMELHLWMPIFYWGHTDAATINRTPWGKKPEWRAITNLGNDRIVNANDTFCFLNPANPEVREFLLGLYRYLLTTYDVDGFELDYIRYRGRDGEDYGYDEYTISGWQKATGQTIIPQNNTSASYWESWAQYRCDLINSFVKSVRELFDEISPRTLLCADVVTDPKEAKRNVYQDYTVWLENDWIDLLKPMSYSNSAIDCLPTVIGYAKGAFVSAGMGIYDSIYSAEDILQHAIRSINCGTDGVTFFEANALIKKDAASIFNPGPFRNRAVTPTYDTMENVRTMLDYTKTRINDIIIPAGGMSSEQSKSLIDSIDAVIDSIDSSTADEVAAKIKAIKVETIDANAKTVLEKDLSYAERIITELPFNVHTEYVEEESSAAGESSDITEQSEEISSISAESTDNSEPESEDGNATTIIIIIVSAVVVVVIAAAAIIIIRKKKTK